MAIIKKPYAGSTDKPYKSSNVWSQVINTVNSVQSGRFNNPAEEASPITVTGESHDAFEAGTMVAFSTRLNNEPLSGVDGASESLVIELEELKWHENLNRAVLAGSPALAKGVAVGFLGSAWAYAKLSSRVPSSIGFNDEASLYAMPDPDEPNKLKAAQSGIYQIIQFVGGASEYAIVNIYSSQPYWRYKLDEPFDSLTKEATAKLIDIGGRDFEEGYTTTITDLEGLMDDQIRGDEGICLHAGSKFHAIQANCS